jgi:hypothetical protein
MHCNKDIASSTNTVQPEASKLQCNCVVAALLGSFVLLLVHFVVPSSVSAYSLRTTTPTWCPLAVTQAAQLCWGSASMTTSYEYNQLKGMLLLQLSRRSCFAGWWCWQQQAYMDQQRALEEKTGATAAAALVQVRVKEPCVEGLVACGNAADLVSCYPTMQPPGGLSNTLLPCPFTHFMRLAR